MKSFKIISHILILVTGLLLFLFFLFGDMEKSFAFDALFFLKPWNNLVNSFVVNYS